MPDRPPSEAASTSVGDGRTANPAPSVVIIGASARAAAFSALRAGLQPLCFDQFGDLDLEAFASVQAVADYPRGLVDRLSAVDDLPVVYTGALENHPEVLASISSRKTVLGNDEGTLEAVRDPVRVYQELRRAHVPCLDVRTGESPPPADGTWLLKPIRGSGGRGVCVWNEEAGDSPTLAEPHYFQRHSSGESLSAVYLAAQDPLQVRYVGLTHQLVGLPELNAPPFTWCGSLGPATLETRGEILTRRIGTVLAHRFGLRGLFGCDFVLNEENEPQLTEVNPRYTGSVEVLELLCGSTLLEDHCTASGHPLDDNRDVRPVAVASGSIVGKVVLYSDRDLIAPDTRVWHHISPWQPLPGFADLPQPASRIRKGSPVCSIFSAATTFAICREQLLQSAESVKALLADCAAA